MGVVMSQKNSMQINSAYPPPERASFPEHEQRLPWLSLLMDAFDK